MFDRKANCNASHIKGTVITNLIVDILIMSGFMKTSLSCSQTLFLNILNRANLCKLNYITSSVKAINSV